METFSVELLENIFLRCPVGDRMLFETINTRFRECMPYHDVAIIDVPHFEKFTQRRIKGKTRKSSVHYSRAESAGNRLENDEFLIRLFRHLVPRTGDRLVGVRFGEMKPIITVKELVTKGHCTGIPIEWNVLSTLLELNPNISDLDFGSRNIRLEALKLLPLFKNLQHLSIYGTNNQFGPILRKLSLISLRIGGWSFRGTTADGTLLRRLIIEHPTPRNLGRDRNRIQKLFPNLEVLLGLGVNDERISNSPVFENPFAGYGAFRQCLDCVNKFPSLRRSILFGSFDLNLPSMISYRSIAVPHIQHLVIQLPPVVDIIINNQPAPGVAQAMDDDAKRVIQSWPGFFDHFKAIKSIKITCKPPRQNLPFRVADLFNLGQLEHLRTLILEEVDPILDENGEQFLVNIKSAKSTPGVVFKRLEKLKIGLKKVRRSPPYSQTQPHLTVSPGMSAYDPFLQFVLSNANRLKTLKLDCISDLGWNSLNSYHERLGDACPLESLHLDCHGNCYALSLPDLASVPWPHLKELDVWCNHDRLSAIIPEHGKWAKTSVERMKGIGVAFPALLCFRWPEADLTPALFGAILSEFGQLRKISLPLPHDTRIVEFFDHISANANLEVVNLVRQERVRQKTLKCYEDEKEFQEMIRKRRAVLREKGFMETEVKVSKERMRENSGFTVM